MPSDCFLDTNILVYAAIGKRTHPDKAAVAAKLVTEQRFGLSSQVLAEFYVTCVRKAVDLQAADLDAWIDTLTCFPVVAVDDGLVRTAIVIARRFQIHYYDAAIVAAAERLGAGVLFTEDLSHGQRYGSVLVQNPFRDL